MSRYDTIECPVCKKPLNNGDEIVVCPECGAPYHRSCFKEQGHCIFPELHKKGESWQAPQKEEETYTAPTGVICSRCGTSNPSYGIFCQVCGNQLKSPLTDQDGTEQGASPQGQTQNSWQKRYSATMRPPFGGPGGTIPPEMPLNPFTTPFGGVAPDEVIDGVSAKDLAIFVNRNSHYFLPHFKQLFQSKAKIINWSAFLFMGGYFLYRKMYVWGVLAILGELMLRTTTILALSREVTNGILNSSPSASYTTVNLFCNFLGVILHFLCGFFANTLYFSHCKKKIAQVKSASQNDDEYYAALAKKGSVAVRLVSICCLVAFSLSMLLYLVNIWMGII